MGMRILAAAIAAIGLLSGAAFAADYPTKPVKVIVGFPPGGSTDAVARFVSQELSAKLGQQFVIDNRAGANGSVGTQAGVVAPNDGYTLLWGTSGVLLVNPHIYPDVKYDAAKDLTPIAQTVFIQALWIVSNKMAAKGITSVKDLVAYAKAHPGELNFGSGGIGNGGHLAGEQMKKSAGIDIVHVPFNGGADATRALIAGDIDMIFSTTPESLPVVRAKQAVPLAAMTFKRLDALPEVPTISEAGVQGAELSSWMGMFAPNGFPKDAIAILNKNIQEIINSAKAKAFLENLALVPATGTPEDLQKLVLAEGPRLKAFLQSSGATVR